jgi:hypothetical protein
MLCHNTPGPLDTVPLVDSASFTSSVSEHQKLAFTSGKSRGNYRASGPQLLRYATFPYIRIYITNVIRLKLDSSKPCQEKRRLFCSAFYSFVFKVQNSEPYN